MKELIRIFKASVMEIKENGLESYLHHVFQKLKSREFYIIDEFANGKDISKINESINDYDAWIKKNEHTIEQLRVKYIQTRLAEKPLISIVMTVYNPPLNIFRETINSVKSQVYENWELCICNGSTDLMIKNEIEKNINEDKRIKVKHIENKGISGNTNEAIALAKGEFIALLDHDDALSPDALFEVTKAINNDNLIDLIYSDSDKITEYGIRYQVFFKPDWSPEILYSSNYVAHLSVFRREIIEKIDKFSSEKDGAQDWDIILQIAEVSRKIHHIPKVLYHWRTLKNSTASSRSAKPFALNSQIMVLNNYLEKQNISAYCIHGPGNYLKCNFVEENLKISIIIPIEEKNNHLKEHILNKIKSDAVSQFEIILIIKNNVEVSEKEKEFFHKNNIKFYIERFETLPTMLNYGAKKASGPLLLFLNLTLEPITPKWITEIVGWHSVKDIGCVSCKIIDKKGIIQHGGIIINSDGKCHYVLNGVRDRTAIWTSFGAQEWYRNFSALTGECLTIRKDLFESNNGFKNIDGYDVDLCLRLREQGYRNVYTPHSKLVSHEKLKNLKQIVVNEYSALKLGDPYFSPHLESQNVTKIGL